MGSEFLFWNSIEIIKAYKSKLISPVEVVNASIKNARKFNQKFNFITEYFEEDAIKKAIETSHKVIPNPDPDWAISNALNGG